MVLVPSLLAAARNPEFKKICNRLYLQILSFTVQVKPTFCIILIDLKLKLINKHVIQN